MITLKTLVGRTVEVAAEVLADHHPFKLTKETLEPSILEERVTDAWIECLGAHALAVYLQTDKNLVLFSVERKPHSDKMHLVLSVC